MSDGQAIEQQSVEATEQPRAPVQAELPIQHSRPAVTSQTPDALKVAEILADNKSMKAKIEELTAAQGQEATARRQAQEKAQAEKHRLELEALQAQATQAAASAKRNAVKAHFRGQLKSDDYLALVPPVDFTEAGDLTPESVEQLDAFRAEKAELFIQPSSATTPISSSGANQQPHGFDQDTANALTMNKIALPGTAQHWQNRRNSDIMTQIAGHNSDARPYGKIN